MATNREAVAALKKNVGTTVAPGADWWGKVTAVNTGPPKTITVHVNGSSTTIECRYNAGYSPSVNDVVFGRMDLEGDLWAVGKLA